MAATNLAPFMLGGPKLTMTFIATAALGAGIGVIFDTANAGQVVVATAGVQVVGFTTSAVQAGMPVNIAVMGSDAIAQANAAITVSGSPVPCKVTAGGQITPITSNYDVIVFYAFMSVADTGSVGSYVSGIVSASIAAHS